MKPKAIQTVLDTIIADEDVLLVIRFGKKAGRDLDLLVISQIEPPQEHVEIIGLDILQFSITRTETLARLRDPLVTEPLLTGSILGGDKCIMEQLILQITTSSPDHGAVGHLLEESMRLYRLARNQAQVANNYTNNVHLNCWSIINSAWCASYLLMARHYLHSASPVCLEDLKVSNIGLDKLINLASSAKRYIASRDDGVLALNELDKVFASAGLSD